MSLTHVITHPSGDKESKHPGKGCPTQILGSVIHLGKLHSDQTTGLVTPNGGEVSKGPVYPQKCPKNKSQVERNYSIHPVSSSGGAMNGSPGRISVIFPT